jgi:hypothetical protein
MSLGREGWYIRLFALYMIVYFLPSIITHCPLAVCILRFGFYPNKYMNMSPLHPLPHPIYQALLHRYTFKAGFLE